MPTEGTWQKWLERLYNLRREKRGAHERPHKPVLLLAIFDLLDRGLITDNKIPLSQELIDTFRRYFDVVRQQNDKPTIENPFFHLCGDGFWHLEHQATRTPLYEVGNASACPSLKALRQTWGRFNDALWETLIGNPRSRHQLRQALIFRYFPNHRVDLAALAGSQPPTESPAALRDEPLTKARDRAFRRTILEIYDYRCAACGIRVKITDDLTLVEAAHLIPFSESWNDRPDNGLALCPNHHWAMDSNLIAPCPHEEYRSGIWRVGPLLDSRIEGQKDLVALENQPVIAPAEEKFYPALRSLQWREEHLRVKY
jgi:putative restriction endonuclease